MANGIGKKTELAQQQIVRYIWNQGLKCGERLPSCATIAKDIHLGEATVFRAIKKLQSEGILTSQDKVGIFVADPRTPGLAGYNIGVLAGCSDAAGVYASALSGYIQNSLALNGCRSVVFHGEISSDSASEDALQRHTGVKQCIERGEIQALILTVALSGENWNYLREKKIPACYIGGFAYLAAPLSVTLSLRKVLEHAFKRLQALGKSRPALFLPKLDTEAEALDTFRKTAALPETGQNCFRYRDVSDAVNLAEQLLAMPQENRPDSIVFLDNYLAQHFYSLLFRRNRMEYLPHPVVLVSKELPFWLPLETDFLEYDIKELSETGVNLLLQALRNPAESGEARIQVTVRKNFIKYPEAKGRNL